jgi:hypothetical protein
MPGFKDIMGKVAAVGMGMSGKSPDDMPSKKPAKAYTGKRKKVKKLSDALMGISRLRNTGD